MLYGELKTLSDEALVHREFQLERELMEYRFRHKTGQLENTSRLAGLRKDIARARTLQRERERTQGLSKDALRNQHRGSFSVEESVQTSESGESA